MAEFTKAAHLHLYDQKNSSLLDLIPVPVRSGPLGPMKAHMSQPAGHAYAAVVFADGQAAQQHGEVRSAMPTMIALWAPECWRAGWDAGDAKDRARRLLEQIVLDRKVAQQPMRYFVAAPEKAVTHTETRVANLLIDMPELGGWMQGSGRHSTLLTELLDANNVFLEEEGTADNDVDLVPWRVRLTRKGILERAHCIAARKSSPSTGSR